MVTVRPILVALLALSALSLPLPPARAAQPADPLVRDRLVQAPALSRIVLPAIQPGVLDEDTAAAKLRPTRTPTRTPTSQPTATSQPATTPAAQSTATSQPTATPAPVNGNLLTDPNLVLSVPPVAKPGYLAPIVYPTFNTRLIRIAGDPGTAFTARNGSGTWGTDVRQHYNDDQAWNADGSLLALQNLGTGAAPKLIFLDGDTYQPKYVPCAAYRFSDDRWHPSVDHKNERINVRGTTLEWFDVVACRQTRSWALPFAATNDLSQNPSADGRYIALWDDSRIFVVDMDPQAPLVSYASGNRRIGPAFDLTNCGLADCSVDHASVSPSGRYVVVIYNGDHPRVLDINSETLVLSPQAMPAASPQCAGQNPAFGYLFDLGHDGIAINPFDNNEEVLIGQRRSWCPSSLNGTALGGVVMVRLRDNRVTSLTTPNNEAYPYHISTLNNARPGWAFVSYWPGSGRRFNDEVIAVRLDGGAVERWIQTHTDTSSCYRCEAHPVPARDGRRIVFASSWSQNCGTGCGSKANPQAYIVEMAGG